MVLVGRGVVVLRTTWSDKFFGLARCWCTEYGTHISGHNQYGTHISGHYKYGTGTLDVVMEMRMATTIDSETVIAHAHSNAIVQLAWYQWKIRYCKIVLYWKSRSTRSTNSEASTKIHVNGEFLILQPLINHSLSICHHSIYVKIQNVEQRKQRNSKESHYRF